MDSTRDETAPKGELTTPGPDCWSSLSRFTSARIALGRAGGSWRTKTLLDFKLAHARARDAVCKPFDADSLQTQISQAGYETARLTTGADTQAVFLKRPDLGRKLSAESRRFLMGRFAEWADRNLVVIVSDGLSALAATKQAVPVLDSLLPILRQAGWTICPIFIVPFARVKLQDEVGALLRACHALALLGERPGLGSPDSLGAYFTFQPGLEKTDADRNCVSNIRPQGLPPAEAGAKLAQLLLQSARQQKSGIGLQEPAASGNLLK